jgi:hypothetical protein
MVAVGDDPNYSGRKLSIVTIVLSNNDNFSGAAETSYQITQLLKSCIPSLIYNL